jgi:predicted dehydrogenase/threonine dehydrogenase-like Zn-dependent dehydrogenase
MKQVIQSLKDGAVEVAELPAPSAPSGVLVRTTRSLISAGTERMLAEFGRANWIQKARQKPDKVRQVLTKVKTDGLRPALEAVKAKLGQPIPLGYSNVGVVLGVGKGIGSIKPGERVVSNGPHAEVVEVAHNLTARIPDAVSDDEAAFTVLGAIALQGVRLAQPTLGERFVVTGLGLIGLLTVQVLRASGCQVLALDPIPSRRALAQQFGAAVADPTDGNVEAVAADFSKGRGVDGVLLTLSSQSDEPVRQAAAMCRKRGRIVLVGVTGLNLRREDFYEKELTFQVSCSYGPGRYDPDYEQKGNDYPIGYVRWTEQRNFEAVLDMMADRRLDVKPLISHRFPIDEAPGAYDLLTSTEPSLGIILEYPEAKERGALPPTVAFGAPTNGTGGTCKVSFIGAGNFASRILMPAFKEAGAELAMVASKSGLSGALHGQRLGFAAATTDTKAAIDAADAVVVATRHDTHAQFTAEALDAGRHVFVEKPLAITHEQVDAITKAQQRHPDRFLMVGFNRRFAPMVKTLAKRLEGMPGPKIMTMTVNAGAIPKEHWTQDTDVGGGRLVGEACHFIDLLRHIAGHAIEGVHVDCVRDATGKHDDSAVITLRFADGSVGIVHYLTNGSGKVSKERLEVSCGGRTAQLDNFRRLVLFGWPGGTKTVRGRQDKGHKQCVKAFVDAVTKGGKTPIPLEEIMEVSRISIEAQQAAQAQPGAGE